MQNDFHILNSIAIILLTAFLGGLIFHRFKQSAIVAYMLSGIIIGPSGFALIKATEKINVLSEIGVILLMFTLGLSFPPKKIIRLGGKALVGGTLQVLLTISGILILALANGWSLFNAFLFGSLLALSSTAIVIKVLNDLAIIDSLHGRLMISFLIVQDIAAILMIAVIPSLSQGSGVQIIIPVLVSLGKAVLFLAVILFLNRKIIPRMQFWVANVGGKEIFLIGIIIFCLGMAIFSHGIGLSAALGAFLAGLIVSESEFNFQILAGMLPFRDTFLCIFFVSLGMLLDPMFLIHYPLEVFLLFLFIIIGKFFFTTVAAMITRHPMKTAMLAGLGLAQMGEFSFVIIKIGIMYKLVNQYYYNLILSSSLLSMLVTPFIINISPKILEKLKRFPKIRKILNGKGDVELNEHPKSRRKHVIICGYGPIGIILGRVLKAKGIPFAALDLNAQTVLKMRDLGIDCYYGDSTSPEVLKKLNIETARLVAITMPDRLAAEATIKNAKDLNPDCYILVRSRFSRELEEFYDFGADSVVQEEFETGLTILVQALRALKFKGQEIRQEVEIFRKERDELTQATYFGKLNFTKLISPKKILLNMKARSKQEAILELARIIESSSKVIDKEEMIKRILEREEIDVTGVGRGVAIPHARTDSVDKVIACIGISSRGIDYGAMDGKPVHIFVLLVANESDHETYLNTLGGVAALFKDEKFCRNIIKSSTPAELLQHLKIREKILKGKIISHK